MSVLGQRERLLRGVDRRIAANKSQYAFLSSP